MIKNIELFVVLVGLLVSILLIFNARIFVRRKMDKSYENTKVVILKVVGSIGAALSMVIIYYLFK